MRQLTVDPRTVTHYVGCNPTGIIAKRLFVIPKWKYKTPVPIEHVEKYQKVKNLIEATHYRESYWYQSLLNFPSRYKKITFHNRYELDRFFEKYMMRMIYTMKEKGYIQYPGDDLPKVTIGSTGEIHKANAGDHRFFTARILGIPSVPVLVRGVHIRYTIRSLQGRKKC